MPAPTLAEVLKQSGWTQEQIDALDANARTGLTNYVSNVYQTAEQKEKAAQELAVKAEADKKAAETSTAATQALKEEAELVNRNVQEFWATTYPAAETEKQAAIQAAETARINAEARAAWLQTQVDGAKAAGYALADLPAFTPPAAPKAEPVKTPGTPSFSQDEFLKRVDRGVYSIQDIGWKYQQLYGTPIPISPSELVAKADAIKLSPMEYAARTFKFAEKDEEHRQAVAKAHDDAIAAAKGTEKDAEWKAKLDAQSAEFAAKERKMLEDSSTHPDLRQPPGSAKYTELRRATTEGERPDPTKMTPEARLKLTQQNLHKRLEERQQQVA